MHVSLMPHTEFGRPAYSVETKRQKITSVIPIDERDSWALYTYMTRTSRNLTRNGDRHTTPGSTVLKQRCYCPYRSPSFLTADAFGLS